MLFPVVLNHVMQVEKPQDICASITEIEMMKVETDVRLKFQVYCRTKHF
jgi:hypothetical protein